MVRVCVWGGGDAAPRGPAATVAASDERGSQAVEFALVMPVVLLLILLVVQAGVVAADLVAAAGIARETARVAAVGDDAGARAAAERAAGSREVRVSLAPPSGARAPGDLVTATLRLRSSGFAVLGAPVWLPAQATMRVEESPT